MPGKLLPHLLPQIFWISIAVGSRRFLPFLLPQTHQQKAALTLPGYFRLTKLRDIIVMHKGQLIAAVELKSQVGPTFGNNFNNRTEEAIGPEHCLWTAYGEGAFGKQPRPFIGWLMVVKDAPGSRTPVRDKSPHFLRFKEFNGASYLSRYDILC